MKNYTIYDIKQKYRFATGKSSDFRTEEDVRGYISFLEEELIKKEQFEIEFKEFVKNSLPDYIPEEEEDGR